ncbi:MAG: serine protease [Acidobacteriota bacterium]|nr:serine protease [Acidobacteriota bacterium]MDH3784867.1 serine protease [Acidobacteriota bacterium]
MARKTPVLVLLSLALTTTALFSAPADKDGYLSVPGHPATLGEDPTQIAARQALDAQWLFDRRALTTRAPGIVVSLTDQDRIDIGMTDDKNATADDLRVRKMRVGVVKNIQGVNFRGVTPEQVTAGDVFAGGQLAATGDGFTWTLIAESPDALGMRVNFDRFSLPAGAEMWVYGENDEAFGPFTGFGRHDDGEFWAELIHTSRAYVQLHYKGEMDPRSLNEIRFDVPAVAILAVSDAAGTATRAICGNASCINTSNSGASATQKAAAGHMRWVSGAFLNICSGALIADTDNSSERPLFLTANHCVSRGKDARNLQVYFNYTSGCSPSGNSTSGSQILSSSGNGDHTLLELNQNPPGGTSFLGWSNVPIASNNNASMERISHPNAQSQSFSAHSVDSGSFTCNGFPRGEFIYSRDTNGATDGGSSGGPVVNGGGLIVGQLFGACGSNLGDVCDVNNNRTMDGALAHYYSSVSTYLDPDGGGDPPGGDCDNDNVCEPGEDCTNCGDCAGRQNGRPANRYCCGDGTEQNAETSALCDGNF